MPVQLQNRAVQIGLHGIGVGWPILRIAQLNSSSLNSIETAAIPLCQRRSVGSWRSPAHSALLFIAAAAVTFFIPRTAQWLLIGMQALGRGRRAIVLGYGPVGQCIARELTARPRARTVEKVPRFWGHILFWLLSFRLIAAADHWWRRGRFVTALHKGVTQPLIEVAKRDNILLVEGDPSDPRLHRHVRINRSSCVFAAVGSDMQTLDAAVSARKSLTRNEHPIRAILSDPDLAANLSEAAPLGFLGATDVRGFSLATEAARLLIAEARFDRIAIEKKQSQVHLLIVGCGAQGEAVAMETLLTAWRTRLAAPVVSIIDRNCGLVRERFRRRAPAAFPEGEPELPQAARIQINFEYADIESLDFCLVMRRSEPSWRVMVRPPPGYLLQVTIPKPARGSAAASGDTQEANSTGTDLRSYLERTSGRHARSSCTSCWSGARIRGAGSDFGRNPCMRRTARRNRRRAACHLFTTGPANEPGRSKLYLYRSAGGRAS